MRTLELLNRLGFLITENDIDDLIERSIVVDIDLPVDPIMGEF